MSDPLNPVAQAFLRSVQHDDDPTDSDCDRVGARLEAQLAASVAVGIVAAGIAKAGATSEAAAPATTPLITGTGLTLMSKIGAAVAVIGVVAGGATAARYLHRAESVASVAAPANVAATARAPATPAEAPTPTPATSPSAPRVDELAAPVSRRSTAARARAGAPPSAERPSPFDAEIALLRAAHTARRGGDPAGALVILQEHDARFPDGALREDCAAERIYALCALGRGDDARVLAHQFIAARPGSPHAAAVRSSCGFAVPK
jgi:hypothetical protein